LKRKGYAKPDGYLGSSQGWRLNFREKSYREATSNDALKMPPERCVGKGKRVFGIIIKL
jgi:hypothetical protein